MDTYTIHVHVHASYIWGHRWNADVELPLVEEKAITDGGELRECESKEAEAGSDLS